MVYDGHQPEKYKQNVDVYPLEKLLRLPVERGSGHSNESLPITAVAYARGPQILFGVTLKKLF